MTPEDYGRMLKFLDSSDKDGLLNWANGILLGVENRTAILNYIVRLLNQPYMRYKDFKIGSMINGEGGIWTISAKKGSLDPSQFQPDFTPDEMLRLGVFGGVYTAGMESEIPIEWLITSAMRGKINCVNKDIDANCNVYKVKSVQSIEEWKRNGWVSDQDPRGWFQWYIRYYLGRRTEDDERQKMRWYLFRRHLGQIKANPGQPRLAQKQACVQWGYNPEK